MLFLILPARAWATNSRLGSITTRLHKTLASEIKAVNFSTTGSSVPTVLSGVFVLVVTNNFLGLLPYVFTSSSHLRFTLPLGFLLWVRLIFSALIKNFTLFIAHLVPNGTPVGLIPFIVVIEVISSLIRPLTLGVRLAANIIAGHLLLVLASTPAPFIGSLPLSILIAAMILLSTLEMAVSIIQGYVFMRLRSLYIREVNNSTLIN